MFKQVNDGQRTPFNVASSNFTSRVAAHTSATKAFSTDCTHSGKPLEKQQGPHK